MFTSTDDVLLQNLAKVWMIKDEFILRNYIMSFKLGGTVVYWLKHWVAVVFIKCSNTKLNNNN